MSKVIEINNLADEIKKAVLEYQDSVNEAVENECRDLAYDLKEELANDPTIPTSNYKHKHYKQLFAVKKATEKDSWHGYKIYNKDYQLTHLLENGHKIFDWQGNKVGHARAFPHWAKADKKAQKLAILIRQKLEGKK